MSQLLLVWCITGQFPSDLMLSPSYVAKKNYESYHSNVSLPLKNILTNSNNIYPKTASIIWKYTFETVLPPAVRILMPAVSSIYESLRGTNLRYRISVPSWNLLLI